MSEEDIDTTNMPTAIGYLRKMRDQHLRRAETLGRVVSELEKLDAPMNEKPAKVAAGKTRGRKPAATSAGRTVPQTALTEIVRSQVREELSKGGKPKDIAEKLEIPVKFVYSVKYNAGRKGGK